MSARPNVGLVGAGPAGLGRSGGAAGTAARALRHSWYITLRNVRRLLRQPAWVAITLIQPMIWLLLFGALFKSVVEIPGFKGGSYIEFLTPGVIVMTAISSAGWNGMAFIDDMRSGVMDRMLVSPVWRSALNVGNLAYSALTTIVQSLIIIGVGLLVGAHFPDGAGGVAVLILVACLLSATIAALSNALALVVRQEETLIAAVTSVILPLTFLSSAFMQANLVPHWIREVSRYNPVNWAAQAGRAAALGPSDWGLVGERVGLLVVLLLISSFLATRAFRAYQRSL
jgi:ABC-2 type transport system permease protein